MAVLLMLTKAVMFCGLRESGSPCTQRSYHTQVFCGIIQKTLIANRWHAAAKHNSIASSECGYLEQTT